jgi:hypothetical protein
MSLIETQEERDTLVMEPDVQPGFSPQPVEREEVFCEDPPVSPSPSNSPSPPPP